MEAPRKFWFHHESNESLVYFASRDGDNYVVTGGNLKGVMHYYADVVEKYIVKDLWVLTVPSKFNVRGILTDNIYSLIKDANNLYVMTGGSITSPIYHYEEEVLNSLYGENPVWEVYTEERVRDQMKDLATPDNFKFRHCSDCEHNGIIFSATQCKDGYRVEWVDRDTGQSRNFVYSNEEVGRYLSLGDWIVVEEVFAKEEPSVKKPSAKKLISINVNSVRAAAEFDVTNNKHTIKKNLSVEEIEQEIIQYVREMYSGLISGDFEWGSREIGARSYTVSFQVEDENYGVISVEVDPSIGMPSFYASVEDFLNQN